MANATYAATFTDQSGQTRLDGTLNFTAPTVKAPVGYRVFPFTFATAGLASGVTIWTPTVGDFILDIGVVITTAFDGTTPKIDVGTFNGGNVGVFAEIGGAAVDGTKVYADVTDNAGLAVANSHLWLSSAVIAANSAGIASLPSWQLNVSAANPVLLVASQNGQKGGTAITSTHGVASVVIVQSLAE